jgi:hypothetical protein
MKLSLKLKVDREISSKFKKSKEKRIACSMNLNRSKSKRKEDQIHLAKSIKTQFSNKYRIMKNKVIMKFLKIYNKKRRNGKMIIQKMTKIYK